MICGIADPAAHSVTFLASGATAFTSLPTKVRQREPPLAGLAKLFLARPSHSEGATPVDTMNIVVLFVLTSDDKL
jgi:hypothetical protein